MTHGSCVRGYRSVLLAVVLAHAASMAPSASASFVTFETGQVRPLALSPDGNRLYAVNTPDDRLEIFDVGAGGLTHAGSVSVGMEPLAVAVRTNGEVWVVNHLSDSVSVVDVASSPPRVVRTLLVGDEPRDIVFAGPALSGAFTRAFVTTARRGQNAPIDPLLTTPGTPRALVWVFDATDLGATLEGVPETIVELFGDTPRALAASPDGATVYAAVFHSGNQTTTVHEGAVCDDSNVNGVPSGSCNVGGFTMPGGLPPPETNAAGTLRPETGLIVKFNPALSRWEDELGRNWNNAVRFDLPDRDVFAIDALADPPVQKAGAAGFYAHVGTVLFNMAANPMSGKVYVSNTEALNEVRFEGPGVFGGSTVRGHLHEARVTVLDGAAVLPRALNTHIDYGIVPSPAGTADASLATPLGMAVSSNGATLYLAAFGSSKVGVIDTAQLEAGSVTPSTANQITVSGGGPSGLVLDEGRDRLYVLTRFDNSISIVDTIGKTEVGHVALYNPEPAHVVGGRPVLYDAAATSSNGEASCAACHVFGDFDSLGWDLGNPDDVVLTNFNPIRVDNPAPGLFPSSKNFHPMKGPMTTQSLRGMANHGPMHWRGDRSGGTFLGDPQALDEVLAFKKFIVAFEGLLGNDGPIPDAEMTAFANFILEVTYPPNPIRALDNSLTPDEQAGRDFFFNPQPSDVFQNCNGCHALDSGGGFFGSDGFSSFEFEPQFLKIPHLRNMYQKVGMFGMPAVPFFNAGDNGHKGDQVRGFGFLHDGSTDTIFRFHNTVVFNQINPGGFPIPNPGGFPNGAAGDPLRRQVEAFMLAFDSNLAPIVGQQATLDDGNGAAVDARLDLLIARAGAGECDLIVKGSVGGAARGYLWNAATARFQSDRAAEPPLTDAALRALAATPGQELTFTCVPPGCGVRSGLDRDEDGFFDRDETLAGSDPADPASVPGTVDQPAAAKKLLIKNKLPDDETKNKIVLIAKDDAIGIPLPLSGDDPRCGGAPQGTVKATLAFSSVSSAQSHQTDLPCENWKLLGSEASPRGYKYKDQALNDGTAKTVIWKAGKLFKAILQGKGPTALDYDLQLGVSQGSVAAILSAGNARLCAVCTGGAGKDGADGKKFLGKDCAAPAECP
jgi:YVTN family beta-propeller protein